MPISPRVTPTVCDPARRGPLALAAPPPPAVGGGGGPILGDAQPAAPTVLDANALWLSSFPPLSVQPWSIVRQSQTQANFDYAYNHYIGDIPYLGSLSRFAAAEQAAHFGVWAGPGSLLSWEGALRIFQELEKENAAGNDLDLVGNQQATEQLAGRIVTASGILPEHVYNFLTHLDGISRDTGTRSYVAPNAAKNLPPLPHIDAARIGKILITIAVVGIAGYGLYKANDN